jgi:sterol desaturase/sphingolipid hydroxylase (fatty acid hydroxylase superfamily)
MDTIKVLGAPVNWTFLGECYTISAFTLVVLIALEWLSWDAKWKKKIQQKEIWKLYKEAWRVNLFHYFFLGPIAYGGAIWYISMFPATWPLWVSAPGLFMTQAVGYAMCHQWMHNPKRYAATHKYHHTFSERTFVRPVSANSTTTIEFIIAYITPIVTGMVVFRPTYNTVWVLVATISLTNLLIHTDMDCVPMGWAPDWMVTNIKHFHHHEKDVKKHYSAPIFDLDRVLGIASKAKK